MDYLLRRGQLNRNTVWQAVNVLALRKISALLIADFPPRMFASRREIASCTVPRVVKINLYPYMWVIRLLESFAWVVCVTDLLMCPGMTHIRLSLFQCQDVFRRTFWDRNIPDGLNCSINFGRVTFEDEQLSGKLLAAVGRAGQDRFVAPPITQVILGLPNIAQYIPVRVRVRPASSGSSSYLCTLQKLLHVCSF